ncbi:putative Lunapark domain-containing protein [Helianthus annuus]|nr:putative Lunapark domain-containing protein [Helianthus annuus]
MAEEKAGKEVDVEKKTPKRGFWSRVWNGLFRSHGDDFEKRLQYICNKEATLIARMKRRSSRWRVIARDLIILSVFLEVMALAYAIVTTRTVELDWQMRALRVLPIFLLPVLASSLYWALFSFTRMRDNWDQKTIDRLRAERQEKIDELKERTNYYITQQLIQVHLKAAYSLLLLPICIMYPKIKKYDPDPAAKAAAASVLASKLGADSGLKLLLADNLQQHYPEATGKSNDADPTKSCGLRKRNTSETASKGGNDTEMSQYGESDTASEVYPHNQVFVEHHRPSPVSQDGGWLARLAQLLVGEDPSQSYALICGNCHMHNGLARKEDFPFITYYCPRCHALNRPRNSNPSSPSTSTIGATSPTIEGLDSIGPSSLSMKVSPIGSPLGDTMSGKVSATGSPVGDTVHVSEKVSAASSPVGEVEVSDKEVAE